MMSSVQPSANLPASTRSCQQIHSTVLSLVSLCRTNAERSPQSFAREIPSFIMKSTQAQRKKPSLLVFPNIRLEL